ncbi:MAG: DegV family protein [Clostridia bacterium]|nr:DegV family protein [Clostridia bacterium]
MAIRITSDSTCDLGELTAKRNIGVMPLKVNLDTDTYLDGVDITPADIFTFVEKTKMLPKTSAPSITDYEEFFAKELVGYDELIHFNISSKSSVSHTVACQAAESFGGRVRVIDSMNLSSGQGLVVLKAADLRDAGKTADEIEEAVKVIRTKVNTSFIPDRLDYLYKGGRCSRMEMYGANLLKIHPMIDMVDGALTVKKKYRGKMGLIIKQYIEELQASYPSYDKTRCFVTHSTADRELVDAAIAKVKELFDFEVVEETVAGSVITGHCGRNTLGVLFIHD